MDAPTLQALTTVAGITIAVAAIEAFLLPALNLSADLNNRFGPLLAVILGVIIGIAATWVVVTGVGKQDIAVAVVNGIFGGLAAVGTHQFVKKTILAKPAS